MNYIIKLLREHKNSQLRILSQVKIYFKTEDEIKTQINKSEENAQPADPYYKKQ